MGDLDVPSGSSPQQRPELFIVIVVEAFAVEAAAGRVKSDAGAMCFVNAAMGRGLRVVAQHMTTAAHPVELRADRASSFRHFLVLPFLEVHLKATERGSISGFDGIKAGLQSFVFDAFSSREPVSTSLENATKRDSFELNRHHALFFCLSMIFSENRFTLFGIML